MSSVGSEAGGGSTRGPFQFPLRRAGTGRRRPVGFVIVIALIALLSLGRLFAGFLTDAWWFADLSHSAVWRTRILTTVALFVVGALISAVVGAVVLLTVGRAAPIEPPDATAARLRFLFGARSRLAGGLAVGAMVLILAPALAHNTSSFLLLIHGRGGAGPSDPVFQRPLGFYLFQLPFLRALTGWLLAIVSLMVFVALVGAHIVGAWRPGQPGGGLPQRLRLLVGGLIASWFVLRGVGYLLDRWHVVASGSGYVDGPGATDLRTRLPGLLILAGITFIIAIAVMIGATRRDVVLPSVAAVSWLVVTLLVTQIVPRAYRQLEVKPNSPGIETRSIQRNIDATRTAYGLTGVKESVLQKTEPTASNEVSAAVRSQVAEELIADARIWGPAARTRAAFNKVSTLDYLRVIDVDMDRYEIDGRMQLVALGALDRVSIQGETWSQQHLERTHGYGVMVAPAGQVVGEGEPRLVSTGLSGKAVVTKQPRLYVGEGSDSYVVAGTSSEGDPVAPKSKARYTGKGGVAVGGFLKKAVFALHFGDRNLLVRSLPNDAKVMYVRDIRKRAEKLAPFLRYDADPYPVVLKDRIVWVLDGYSVTNNYPYSQHFNASAVLDPASGLYSGDFNAVRSAVKVVIDGYDGNVTMYRTSKKGSDPIVDTWASVFPKLFTDGARLEKDNPGLSAHLRYPEDLFRLQSVALGRYHVTTAAEFVDLSNDWTPSLAAATTSSDASVSDTSVPGVDAVAATPAEDRAQVDPDADSIVATPLFLRHRYPGEKAASFVLQQTLELRRSTGQRRLLRGVIVADSDPANYGRIRFLAVPPASEALGAARAFDRMRANKTVSTEETQLGQRGSKVNFGDVQVLPTDAGIVYQRPMFLKPESSDLEELKYVLVLAGDRVKINSSVRGAFTEALVAKPAAPTGTGTGTASGTGTGSTGTGSTGTTPTGSGTGSGTGPVLTGTVDELLAGAADSLDLADVALKAGDLGAYQARVNDARRQIEAAQAKATPPS